MKYRTADSNCPRCHIYYITDDNQEHRMDVSCHDVAEIDIPDGVEGCCYGCDERGQVVCKLFDIFPKEPADAGETGVSQEGEQEPAEGDKAEQGAEIELVEAIDEFAEVERDPGDDNDYERRPGDPAEAGSHPEDDGYVHPLGDPPEVER